MNQIKKFLKKHWLLILGLIYIVSPLDLLPEAIFPGVGYVDDAFVLGLELVTEYYRRQKESGEKNSNQNSPQKQ
jgi:uncharacterized membrane protein YkvA (DUF1232 family)